MSAIPKRQLSFSIDSILAEDNHKERQNRNRYSPYKTELPEPSPLVTSRAFTASPVSPTSPSYGTEALDARLQEFYFDGCPAEDDALDNSTESHTDTDKPNSPQEGEMCDSDSLKMKTKKKTRTVFSRQQVFYLEAAFDAKRYLSSAERSEIATSLNLSETQVKVWFQNRRNKWKAQINGDGKPASPDSVPIFFPPFLCGALANAQAQRGQPATMPGIPYFRQQSIYY